jgi:hypothetical protein
MKHSMILVAACALGFGAADAATNGTLGTTSTGTQMVSVSIRNPADNRVRVSGLTDVNFGSVNAGRQLSQFTSFCFYHTSPSFSLTVQQPDVTSSGFALTGPNGATIPLTLSLQVQDASNFFFSYEPANGVTRTGLTGNTSSETCSFGFSNSGNYSINPPTGQVPGAYTGTLTFVMAVE